MSFKLINSHNTYSEIIYEELVNNLDKVSKLFYNTLEDKTLWESIKANFLEKGDIFLIDNAAKPTFKFNETISVDSEDNPITYYANNTGYLGYENGILKIHDPYISNSTNLKLYFIYLPVNNKLNSLKRLIENNAIEKVNYSIPSKILIKEGKPPKDPINAKIEWKVTAMDHPPLLNNGKIDYKSYSQFKEVEKDTVLAEKILMAPGLPGVDVYNNIIEVPKANDVAFFIGDNIYIDRSIEGREVYKAQVTGLLDAKANSLSISRELKIDSDIGFETGNIKFSGDIEINGNVKSMFTVYCGGDLNINGSVENGANINCEGNVNITKGIIGHDTKINIKKDLDVEYIQDCKMRIGGNLTVLNSIYHSNVFSRGFIIVKGKSLHGVSHGSVVGGVLGCMKGMELHSVGSIASGSRLVCGVDLELKEDLLHLKEIIPILNTKILKLQNSLEIDYTHNSLDVASLTSFEKQKLKSRLKELKDFIIKRDDVESMVKSIKDKIYEEDLETIKIVIDKFILEDTKITIGDCNKVIKNRESNSIFSLFKNEIVKLSRL